jgi:hypothetical protein
MQTALQLSSTIERTDFPRLFKIDHELSLWLSAYLKDSLATLSAVNSLRRQSFSALTARPSLQVLPRFETSSFFMEVSLQIRRIHLDLFSPRGLW